jgi:hypothetical protein
MAAFPANTVGKGGRIAVFALDGLHGMEPIGAGISAEVAAGAGSSFLRYCHSGADNSRKDWEIPHIFPRPQSQQPLSRPAAPDCRFALHKIIEIKKDFKKENAGFPCPIDGL